MASPSKVVLDTNVKPVFHTELREDSAKRASELLQENHEKYYILFNKDGFHNHIAHHLLTIYALGASPEEIQTAYDFNASYQRPPKETSSKDAADLKDPAIWKQYLGDEAHYYDFLIFFQREMEESSSSDVINKFLFARDERSEDLFVRLHSGFFHPLLHLGFGVEFRQPAIVAEALAQAAVHSNWIGDMLLPAEQAADKSNRKKMERSIASLIDECNGDPILKTAAHWKDGNKVRDGILARAPDETIAVLSQVVVGEDEIEQRMVEMMNAALYFTACAQRPNKVPKIDFYFMHCVNSSIFFPSLLASSSPLSAASKKRLLEYKIRMDIGLYISRRAPDLRFEDIRDSKAISSGGWDTLFEKMCKYADDGHTSKLMRTVAAVEKFSQPYEKDKERFRLRGSEYLNIGHLVMDSVHGKGGNPENPRWVRSVGFNEAWEKIADR